MLLALLEDAAGIEGLEIVTTWDRRLGAFPLPGIDIVEVDGPDEEPATFRRLARECDSTYVIAPELDDVLTTRCRLVLDAGGRSLNSSLPALRLCSDKWELAQRLKEHRVPTIPTVLCGRGAIACGFPAVLKPRFGAGSQDIYYVRDRRELEEFRTRFDADRPTREGIIQPYVRGLAASVAAVFNNEGRVIEIWPVAWQHLSNDGRLRYIGGRLPAETEHREAIEELVRVAASAVEGLRGYVGFDIAISQVPPAEPLLVEINPRLTTSYLGYRALADGNLAPRILRPDQIAGPAVWRSVSVRFATTGTMSVVSGRQSAWRQEPPQPIDH